MGTPVSSNFFLKIQADIASDSGDFFYSSVYDERMDFYNLIAGPLFL